MHFRNYRLSKIWLDHSLKSAFSEHPLTVIELKGPKHLWNLHKSTFIKFSHHSEGKWFWKFLPYWSLKSEGCLLRHWLPIGSILFRIVKTCPSLFKWNYLINEKLFLTFFRPFMESGANFTVFLKKKHRHS